MIVLFPATEKNSNKNILSTQKHPKFKWSSCWANPKNMQHTPTFADTCTAKLESVKLGRPSAYSSDARELQALI